MSPQVDAPDPQGPGESRKWAWLDPTWKISATIAAIVTIVAALLAGFAWMVEAVMRDDLHSLENRIIERFDAVNSNIQNLIERIAERSSSDEEGAAADDE